MPSLQLKTTLLSLYFLIAIPLCSLANMAEPVERGTLISNPFLNKYVDVVHESINISLGNDYKKAFYQITYSIRSNKQGIDIPFLFYALEYSEDMKIVVDGKEVILLKTPDYLQELEDSAFKDFALLYQADADEAQNILNDVANSNFYVNASDMHYFKCSLDSGFHKIEVSYVAAVWADKWDWIKSYSFRYALAPAKYWKSFGSLRITIQNSDFPFPITCSLGEPDSGSLLDYALWEFNALPADMLHLNFEPEISPSVKRAQKFGGFNIALVFAIILLLLHVLLLKKQIDNASANFKLSLILGAVIIPLCFVLIWWSSYWVFDSLVADHGSGASPYSFIIFLFYLIIAPAYLLLLWLFAAIYRRTNKP